MMFSRGALSALYGVLFTFGLLGGITRAGAEEMVKFALIAPLSGAMAHDGQMMLLGAKLAVEDINAKGGIKALNGAKVDLIIEDAGATPESAKNAAQRLVANNPDVVAGTGAWSSSLTLAATEVTERAGLPWLTLSYADKVTERGFKYVFKTTLGASKIANETVPTLFVLAEKKTGRRPTKVALIGDSTAAARDFFKSLREGGLKDSGAEIVVDETFTPPLADATSIVQKLRAARPDFLLFYPTGFPDIRLVINAMNEFGLGGGKLPVIAVGTQFASPEMLASVGPKALQGLIAVVANTATKKLSDELPELTRRSGQPWLGQDTIGTYGDILLMKEAVERAGSTNRDAVAKALHEMNLTDGPARYYLGERLAFDAAGRRIGGAVGLVQWQDGKPYLVSPLDEAVKQAIWTAN